MELYEPAIARIKRQEKARAKQEKREKYKRLYQEELAKEQAKLKAQREHEIELYKTKRAIEKAHAKALRRVKPFTPRTMFKIPSKRLTPEQKKELKKAGVYIGKTTVKLGRAGLSILDSMYGGGKGGLKVTRKRKSTKRKPAKRKYAKQKYRKTAKRKGKTYYCRKCKARHSYSSKIGRKHR